MTEFLQSSAVWGVLLTLAAFALGTWINRRTGQAFLNPLLLGTVFVIVFLSVLSIPYATYKASAAPVSYLLLPATVSLAVPLYEKWELLCRNLIAIFAGILSGVAASLGSILALSLLLRLNHTQYVTMLPKSVTTAIGMDVAAELGGIAALTGALVILTGIVGALLAETVCTVFHITDPIAKGIGIGTASHAIGTAKALQMGEVEGAMSGLAVAVAGVLTAILGKQEAAVQFRLIAVAVVMGVGAVVGNIRAGQQGGAVGDFQRHIAFQVQRTADKYAACQPHRAALRGCGIDRRLHRSRVLGVTVSRSPVAAGLETIIHLAFLRQRLLLFPERLCRDGSHTAPSG